MPRFPRIARFALALFLACALRGSGAARASDPAPPLPYARVLVEASGVLPLDVDATRAAIQQLAEEFAADHSRSSDARTHAQSIHEFLHRRALTGKYRADASNLHDAIHGGPFNCAAATALFLTIARQTGLQACAVSTPGHVWCRVRGGGESIDLETTCRDWFAIADRDRHRSDADVSPAMAEHRRRVRTGRELSDREFLAVFHFNRGVGLIEQNAFEAAIAANVEALACDPRCRPASQNLAAVLGHLCTRPGATLPAKGRLMLQVFSRAWTAATRAQAELSQPQFSAIPRPANSVLTSAR